jgi:hypothetical protein
MIDTGLPLKQDSKTGRESQSRAFLRTPGIPWLYSGVTISTPSASAIVFFNFATADLQEQQGKRDRQALDRGPLARLGGAPRQHVSSF